LVQAEGDILL